MAKNDTSEWALALLRIVLGVIFLYHGYLKLFVAGGFKATVGFFTTLGIPVPLYSALLVSVAEFAGGILLIVGVITRLASLVLIFEMLVALFAVHIRNGFLVSKGGYEFVLLIIAGLVVVLNKGAGKLAWGKSFKSKSLQ